MKTRRIPRLYLFIIIFILIMASLKGVAQVVTVSPAFPKATDIITVTFDATLGSGGLKGSAGPVYIHSGLITNKSTSISDWKYTKGNWGKDDGIGKMTSAGTNKWTITIPLSGYYGTLPTGEVMEEIALVFRNADGTKTGKNADGSDILLAIYNSAPPTASLPSGITDGINYLSPTSVVFCLYAPNKSNAFIKGDFNNWHINDAGMMNRTPDGIRYWIQIDNLVSGKEYGYQYFVDGYLTVADAYCDKILDPWNDKYIKASVYPGLMAYPAGKTNGIVSVFQPGQTSYAWKTTNFKAPAVSDLVIYELLLRDFFKSHTYKALIDTLDYLKILGINALELMPVMEFEGNESWGYNPAFMFAPDKYYGPKDELKTLIDKAHEKGMAVILDNTLNHQFQLSPLVQLYWDPVNNAPAANSPWFNQVPKHPYNVGYDFNHESQATKDFVDRVNKYWMQEYKVDGFRFDLTKGFTQKNCGDDVGCWMMYDQSRIDLLKRMYDNIKTVNASAYVILEHLSDNAEETVLANYGMMPWGKMVKEFSQNTMGYGTSCDIGQGYHKARGWAYPNLVSYMESHDEERVMYSNLQFGNVNGTYNVKDLKTSLNRMKAAGAFLFLVTGPKMIYQFSELGYEIGSNVNGHIGNKPIHWEYYSDPDRFSLYETWAQIINLKHTYPLFANNIWDAPQYWFDGLVKRFKINDATMDVIVVGNFDVVAQNVYPDFNQTGTWYDYLGDGSALNVTNAGAAYNLQPGEFHIWTSKKIDLPVIPKFSLVTSTIDTEIDKKENQTTLSCFPNPANYKVNISSTLDLGSNAKITIVDIVGREVKVIHDGFINQGTTLFEWEIKNSDGEINEGVYFVRMETKDKVKIEKVVLFR